MHSLKQNGTKPRLADDANLIAIGQDPKLNGYTGADLSSLVKEAATQALQEFVFNSLNCNGPITQEICVHLRHFQLAVNKIRPSVNEKVRHVLDFVYRCYFY